MATKKKLAVRRDVLKTMGNEALRQVVGGGSKGMGGPNGQAKEGSTCRLTL